MKNFKDIINHFDTIETVMIEADNCTIRVTGYLDDKSFMNGFDCLRVTYNNSKVAKKVSEKISYFIGI